MTLLNPYLMFKDNAREAMEFYQSAFGGNLRLDTFKEHNVSPDPSEDNKIMHAQLETPNGMVLMGADTPNRMGFREGSNGAISLSGEDDAELTRYYSKLSAGGVVQEPLKAAPWGDKFGMFVDKYGVEWMVNITAKRA